MVLGLLEAQGSPALAPALQEPHRLRAGPLLRLMRLVVIASRVLRGAHPLRRATSALPASSEAPGPSLVNQTRQERYCDCDRRTPDRATGARRRLHARRDGDRDVVPGFRSPSHQRWTLGNADEKTVLGAFSPGRVRRRVAADVYPGRDADLAEAWEYQVHSQGLHPDPRGHPHSEKAVETWEGEGKLLFEAGEILGHALGFFKSADFVIEFVDDGAGSRPRSHTDVALLQQAHDVWIKYTERMQ